VLLALLQMMVDLARRHDLNVHVDISFPAIPCAGNSKLKSYSAEQ
jgi:hypothetical protein